MLYPYLQQALQTSTQVPKPLAYCSGYAAPRLPMLRSALQHKQPDAAPFHNHTICRASGTSLATSCVFPCCPSWDYGNSHNSTPFLASWPMVGSVELVVLFCSAASVATWPPFLHVLEASPDADQHACICSAGQRGMLLQTALSCQSGCNTHTAADWPNTHHTYHRSFPCQ